jgi:hypothetical protein
VGGGLSLGRMPTTGASGPERGRASLAGGGHGAEDETSLALHASSRHAAQLAPPSSAGGAAVDVPQGLVAPLAPLAPPPSLPASPPAGLSPSAASLEDLMPGLVRRIAWSGDGRRGSLRLEVGSGALAGASVLVQSTGGRVDVTLGSAPGSSHTRDDLEAWRDRIAARLEARGIDVGAVDVA